MFAAELDWAALEKHRVVDKVARPWIAKKIKEYLGVEEAAMINLVVS